MRLGKSSYRCNVNQLCDVSSPLLSSREKEEAAMEHILCERKAPQDAADVVIGHVSILVQWTPWVGLAANFVVLADMLGKGLDGRGIDEHVKVLKGKISKEKQIELRNENLQQS